MSKSILEMEEEIAPSCIGRTFRCKTDYFFTKKGEYLERLRMIPLKKLSCEGCEWCGYIDELISEQSFEGIRIESPINGRKYHLVTKSLGYDYYGDYEGDELWFQLIKNPPS